MKTFQQQADELRADLSAGKKNFRQIARLAEMSNMWLTLFVRGDIPNPGIKTLDKLRKGLQAAKSVKKGK